MAFKIDIIEIYKQKEKLTILALVIGFFLALTTTLILYFLLLNLIKKSIVFLALILTIAAIVGLTPYMALEFLLGKEQKAVENAYPSWLRDLAESVSSGLGLIKSIELTSKADYGALNKYIRKLVIWLSWGVPFPEAMQKFNEYFKFSPTIRRANEIILEIYKSGGDIVKTLRELADNVEKTRELYKDVIAQVKSKVFVIYMIYLILLVIAIMIKPIFAQVLGSNIGLGQGQTLTVDYFKFLSLLMIISFAFSTSIMAAAVVGGNVADAIKHASIMFLIGLTAYVVAVLPPTVDCKLVPAGKDKMVLEVSVDGQKYNGKATVILENKTYHKIIRRGRTSLPLVAGEPVKVIIPTDFGNRTCTAVLPGVS